MNGAFFYQHISINIEAELENNFMQELIQQLTSKAGLNEAQAHKAIEVIAGFVKQKFPMAGGMMDNVLKGEGGTSSADGGFKIPGL
jgi:hypothetical protein